ncbi:MAG: hypothetical protein K6C35_04550 [Eubacterium sp.]|nr:hypothetical protein [Eubacterium sp.]
MEEWHILLYVLKKYLITKHKGVDWTVLSEWMWKATSEYWDEWADKFIEIVPEYLYEFDSFEESSFEYITEEEYNYFSNLFKDNSDEIDGLLKKLLELEEVYCYTSIPGKGRESIQIVLNMCNILKNAGIDLPDPGIVSFSSFNEKNGWGEDFDGRKLSLIL